MKVLSLEEFNSSDAALQEVAQILRRGKGLVCFPCASTYRFGVSLLSEKGVLNLLQTKRRSGSHPALVLVRDAGMVQQVAQPVSAQAEQAIRALWPGRVTLRLPLSKELPRKVYKDLSKPDGKVGVRQPGSMVAQRLVDQAAVPLLVSSANRSKKTGASSVASIRRLFARQIDLFIDAGDLPPQPPSTILDFEKDGALKLVREGEVSEAEVLEALKNGG